MAKRILIIDDDAPMRTAVRTKLEQDGYDVLEAKDGGEGVGMASLEHPDLVILDILMPRVHGIELLKQLRQTDEWGKKVPIIILTNIESENEKSQAANLGVPDYLLKSQTSIEDLSATVGKYLGS